MTPAEVAELAFGDRIQHDIGYRAIYVCPTAQNDRWHWFIWLEKTGKHGSYRQFQMIEWIVGLSSWRKVN
jgi:hypothetical protein